MRATTSLTRRLTVAVLLLELVAALLLIVTVGIHERDVQQAVFRANLRASANALFGAVEEAATKDGSIALDDKGVKLSPRAAFLVSTDGGKVLGAKGDAPALHAAGGTFAAAAVHGEPYLFYTLVGERAIDPGKPFAVIHPVRVMVGMPSGRVGHELRESLSFFAVATLVLLGLTALVLTWLIRRYLLPIRELAGEAEKITGDQWAFAAPESSKRFVELAPLAGAMEASVARLRRSFDQQRRFTSDAAHELKTDLAIAKSSLQLLGMKRREVEEYEKGLRLSLDDLARLEGTIGKMLTLARLEQAAETERPRCELAESIADVVTQSMPVAEMKRVGVIVRCAEDTSVAVGREDAALLCSNLLMNAVQHSPDDARVEITVVDEREAVRLVVRDYGAGISERDLPHVFEAFYRGDASRSRKTGGTGLGLSICKALVERAGGTIAIGNAVGGGAVVEVVLPRA